MRQKAKKVYRKTKSHSDFTESPWERVGKLTLSMFSNPTLPNIMLGSTLTASIQYSVGLVPFRFVSASTVAWVIAVVVYAVGDEVTKALQAAKQEWNESEDTKRSYQ